ncbi:MAG: LPS-assembly protein LptD, partial [Verrucomicrobia bacterium]|nr:LPS-assembly protein LptD [Verrucomicrobiota bacterium]
GVSDDRYFVDYSRSIVTSADRILPRVVSFSRGLGEDWSLGVSVQRFQSILDARPGPYEREPQVTARWLARDRGGFDSRPDPARFRGRLSIRLDIFC